jgi:hypothetical protein
MRKNSSKLRTGGYQVGKGRPPLTTRWKRGQSGNPSGRPKGSRNVSTIVNDVIGQKFAVTENGRKRRIPALEVVLCRLRNDAMQGDPRALKLVLSLVDRYAEAPDAAASIEGLLAEDQIILERYLKKPSEPATDPAEESDDGEPDDDI